VAAPLEWLVRVLITSFAAHATHRAEHANAQLPYSTIATAISTVQVSTESQIRHREAIWKDIGKGLSKSTIPNRPPHHHLAL